MVERGEQEGIRFESQRLVARVILTGMAVLFAGLCLRLIHINTFMAPRLAQIAMAQQESLGEIPARRGSILDARGRVLAGSRIRHSVFADPVMIEHPDEVATALAPILDMDAGEIENEIRSTDTPRFCWLKRKIDDAEADAIRKLRLTGIGLEREFERYWPMGETAAHVLGIVGSDGRGLEGIELQYDAHLRGTPGRRSVLRDARRRPIGRGSTEPVEPRDGGHVVLTIDAVIQEYVQERLAEQVAAFRAESGLAIVLSPRNGDVLAMACHPVFDPNHYLEYDPSVRRNRCITDPSEPGSTFKPFIVVGALEGGWVNKTEKIDCHDGLYFFGSRRMHDTKPHGLMDVRDIVVYSSNIGMGIIGTRMGNDALHEIITRLGFGSLTQIDLRGESEGIVLPVRQWTSYSTTSVTMGQELAVTPIQLANALSALVNNGYLLRPRCVRSVLSGDYAMKESHEDPEVIRRVLPESIARYMREQVLTGVVERGEKELDASPYSMCGKTGTAQIPYKHRRGYEPDAYLSSFIGAAPVCDPEVVVLVMIRKPDRSLGHYGRYVAGPAVRDIVRHTLTYLQVPPDEPSLADVAH